MPGMFDQKDIRVSALAFSACAVLAHGLSWAQPLWAYWLIAGGLALLVRNLRLVAVGALGLGWTGWNVAAALQAPIDAACGEVEVAGRVAGLPTRTSPGAGAAPTDRFEFVVDRPSVPACVTEGRLRLVWLAGPGPRGGEAWSLRVRLRPPSAAANEHGFDAGRWHMRNGTIATGYVTAGRRGGELAAGPAARLDRFRERLRDGLGALPLVNPGILAALTIGDAAAIPRADLERYRRTTTMHLLVISGLHVGVVTAFGFLLGRAVAFLLGVRTKPVAIAGGLLCGAGYVLIAGAGLSLVRAFTMSTAGMLALVSGRTGSAVGAFGYASVVVLLLDPMAPLVPGFWLSFGAVAVLLGFFAPRSRRESWLIAALKAQLAMALVFAPLVIAIIGLIHPLSVLVNLAAVPLVTLLTVPLALVGTVLIGWSPSEWLLIGADFCVSWCDEILRLADRIHPVYIATGSPWLYVAGAAAGMCLLPVSRLAKAGLASVVVLIMGWSVLGPPDTPQGHVDVEVLDVGQGTSVLVRTRGHTLVYDAGPAFQTGADAGSGVVLPALHGRGLDEVDALVLSHSDLDHVGGAESVVAGIQVKSVLAGEVVPGVATQRCVAGTEWQWDGVRFRVVWPPRGRVFEGNDASCVLLIETHAERVLLAGDIGRAAELALDLPRLDLLLVPHHGSATSSSPALVGMTRPAIAVVGAGWDSHFGHPHPTVVDRYRSVGAHIVSTAVSGAVRWRSTRPGVVDAVRCRPSPYWRTLPTGPWRRPSALSRQLADCRR